jgi:hypothetical protein
MLFTVASTSGFLLPAMLFLTFYSNSGWGLGLVYISLCLPSKGRWVAQGDRWFSWEHACLLQHLSWVMCKWSPLSLALGLLRPMAVFSSASLKVQCLTLWHSLPGGQPIGLGAGSFRPSPPFVYTCTVLSTFVCVSLQCTVYTLALPRREIILSEANPMSDVFQNIDPHPPHRPASV